ncbi:MAG: hypothetical protein HY904_18485 [Deltaproteobacteria bacterium]|nr:hypothetical protein [Deltaproteobacteria bacterium]
MSCPRCGAPAAPGQTQCDRCVAVFAADDAQVPTESLGRRVLDALLYVPPHVNRMNWAGRAAVLALLVPWGAWFISRGVDFEVLNGSFLHRVDLAFHEFGHLVFTPLGRFMMFLGGSLFQLLVPGVLAVAFVFGQRNPFGAAVCTWWLGQSLLDLAPYVDDARSLAMPLIGEWSDEALEARAARHDWHNILSTLGWLRRDHSLAKVVFAAGCALMVVGCAWGGWILYRQWSRRSDALLEEPDLHR